MTAEQPSQGTPPKLDPFPDIAAGLALHLDPDELERLGGTYTCAKPFRVQGGHFFLCLDDDGSVGRWLPLYSQAGTGRVALTGARSGHPKWTGGTFHYQAGQVWTAAHAAIAGAAAAGQDKSTPGSRNLLDSAAMPMFP
jgi:hypothetical protein